MVCGHKFSICAIKNGIVVGVAIVGRPVARKLDNGLTLEVTRVSTDGTRNACSALYAECKRRTLKAGYKRLVTYTQAHESGASLKALGIPGPVNITPPANGWNSRPGRSATNRAAFRWELI